MKKTFTINISGSLFHIEEDAYEKLQEYIQKLKVHFGSNPEGREIISDIEGRISELFIERTKGDNKVITLELVQEVISIMGTPEDFMDQQDDMEYTGTVTSRKRRLYRSPDSRVIAGVCGGLGAYFKMDPVWVRIIFILLLFVNGIGLLAYLILWVAVPRARTTTQKLEMKGEEVTITNIERTVRDQSADSESPAGSPEGEAGDENTSATASKGYGSEKYNKGRVTDTSASVGKAILRVIAVVFGAFFLMSGFMGLIALISTLIVGQSVAGIWPVMWSHDLHISGLLEHFITPGALSLGILSIAILVGIPLLAMLFIGTKMIFSYKTNNTAIGLGMVGVWLIALITLTVVTAGQAGNFKNQTSLTNTETIICDPCPTLYLQVADDKYSNYSEADWDLDRFRVVTVDGKNIMLGQPRFDIEKSNTDDIVLVFRKKSRGKDQGDANRNIQDIIYNYQVKDSLIVFDRWFLTGTDSKWRDQRMDIILKLPEGKTVHLSDSMADIIFDIENVSNTWDREMVGKFWEMRPEGLTMKNDSANLQ